MVKIIVAQNAQPRDTGRLQITEYIKRTQGRAHYSQLLFILGHFLSIKMSSPRLHGTSEHVGGSLPARSDALRSVNSDGISYFLGQESNTPSIRSLSSAHNATSSDDHPEPTHVELQSLLSSGQQVSSELRASSPAPTVSALSVGSNQANATSASPAELRKPAQSYSRWQKYRRYCKDSWLPEFLVMLLSISCTVAIAAVLKAYE